MHPRDTIKDVNVHLDINGVLQIDFLFTINPGQKYSIEEVYNITPVDRDSLFSMCLPF